MAVAQIDPLSVSYLLKSKDGTFSLVGRSILRVWSSFDDPMTILLSIFVVAPLTFGNFHNDPFSYLYAFCFNLLFAGIVFIFQKFISNTTLEKMFLIICLVITVLFNLTLGIALVALFLRPKVGKELSIIVTGAFFVGVFLLGMTVLPSLQAVIYGILLGILAFSAQIIATFLIAKKLSKSDKLHLALAQYNGITSIGLGIFFQHYFFEITSIIAMAVIIINSIYYVANHFVYKMIISD